MSTMDQLNNLVALLDAAMQKKGDGHGDALDAVVAGQPRRTQVRRVREDEAVVQFQRELTDGLIRVDTAGRLLNLVTEVVSIVLAGRA